MARPVVLLTGVGTTRSIGVGISRKLAAQGWDLALTHWSPYDGRLLRQESPEAFQEFQSELQRFGGRVVSREVNLEETSSSADLFAWLHSEVGAVNALVLSHCESVPSSILDTSEESFDRHFAVNVRASWKLIQQFALQVADTGGSIVALTSDHTVGNLPYGASKAALDRIVLAAARELAHRNIRANLINPGPIDTGWMTKETKEVLLQRQPSGRLGTPEDTASLVAFLLSPEGAWINGQLLKSDGGLSA